eukprot:jgi/Mesen1/8689/ME000517S08005
MELQGSPLQGAADEKTEEAVLNPEDRGSSKAEEEQNDEAPATDLLERMRTLDLGVVEGMPEEEIAQNIQDQEYELEALKSIFGDDFQQLDSTVVFIAVHVELTEAVKIVARLPQSLHEGIDAAAGGEEREDGTGLPVASPIKPKVDKGKQPQCPSPPGGEACTSEAVTVQHLPPMHLLCVFPASYPSRTAPRFRLSCLWLSRSKLSRLCEGLDVLWSQHAGQVVVYLWADWLSRDCFSHLGIKSEIELDSYGASPRAGGSADEDERTVPESVSLEQDVTLLMRYNEERKLAEFRRSLLLCNICFCDKPGLEFVRLPCLHMFCWDCTTALAVTHVADGTLAALTCPDTSCKAPLPPGLLREVLDKEAFARWESLTLQRTLDTMEDLVYCPRCSTPCLEDTSGNHAQCSQCFFSFCGLCRDSWHSGNPCMDAAARLRVMQSRRAGRTADEEQRRREKDLLNEMQNLQYVSREASRCPKCRMAISKTEGCNKMTCANCNAYFCYKCGKAINGYDHFGSGKCVLFEQEDVDAWERQNQQPEMDVRGQFAQAAVAMWPARRRLCPSCHQQNLKEGNNNHMLCWACRNHFCASCGKIVRSSAEHFGPNKCKQHSAN